MTSESVRLLLLADTHLGFDLPFRPRVERRRRGPDFFANFEKALEPALRQEVDIVVHGGDLLYRSRVPTALVDMALAPLVRVAARGVPVLIVPGNHERARIPRHLWSAHPHIHIFDTPRTFNFVFGGLKASFSGFPFARNVRDEFKSLVAQSGCLQEAADVKLLCIHQAVEGAQVGTADYTFRDGPDVIRGADIPDGCAAVLAGHIHRRQVLREDLAGRPLPSPVIYPGSIERTSFAERREDKGFVILEVAGSDEPGGQLLRVEMASLPTRPMANLVVDPRGLSKDELRSRLRRSLLKLDPDSVVRIQVRGELPDALLEILSASNLRSLAPKSMNVSLAIHWKLPAAE